MGTDGTYKITVKMRRRSDGGLRVWSDQVPGLTLSHSDPQRVLNDIEPALEVILEGMLGCAVKAERLSPFPVFGQHVTLQQKMLNFATKRFAPIHDLYDRAFGHMFNRIEFAAHPCH